MPANGRSASNGGKAVGRCNGSRPNARLQQWSGAASQSADRDRNRRTRVPKGGPYGGASPRFGLPIRHPRPVAPPGGFNPAERTARAQNGRPRPPTTTGGERFATNAQAQSRRGRRGVSQDLESGAGEAGAPARRQARPLCAREAWRRRKAALCPRRAVAAARLPRAVQGYALPAGRSVPAPGRPRCAAQGTPACQPDEPAPTERGRGAARHVGIHEQDRGVTPAKGLAASARRDCAQAASGTRSAGLRRSARAGTLTMLQPSWAKTLATARSNTSR
jgi:hypothetical protein